VYTYHISISLSSVCSFVDLSLCLCIYILYIYLSVVCLFVEIYRSVFVYTYHISISLSSVCSFVDLSICLCIYILYIYLSNYLHMNFTYIPILPTYPSFCLFLCLPLILCIFYIPLMINFLTVILCIFKEVSSM